MILITAFLPHQRDHRLQWSDLNWEHRTLVVIPGSDTKCCPGPSRDTKTEASRLPLPVDPSSADAVKLHWQRCLRRELSDWVLANQPGEATLPGKHFCDGIHQTCSRACRRRQDWLAHISTLRLEP